LRERENEEIRKSLEVEFRQVDVNRDGFISKEELRDYLVAKVAEVEGSAGIRINEEEYDRLVSKIFEDMDKDKDRTVALNEFVECYWVTHLNL
jgi:Ca2+-binding EF-hand superfamily protein